MSCKLPNRPLWRPADDLGRRSPGAALGAARSRCRRSRCRVADAVGRVLAEDVAARRTQPPFAVSAMDGYAVRAEDVAQVPVTLRIVAEIPAGAGFGGTSRTRRGRPHLHRRAIARRRRRDRDPGGYRAQRRPGRDPRRRAARPLCPPRPGSISPRATCCCSAGRRLTPRDIGLAAAMNRPWLFVHRRPRVAILSTGDEIVMPGDPIGPHQIVSSNALALVGLCDGLGRRAGAGRQRAGRSGRAAPHRGGGIAASICSSRPAASRSASTIWCATCCPRTGWRSISGRSRCGPASR